MSTNKQVPEAKYSGDGAMIEVHSIFYTIQGEGPYSGHPAVFVRLAGCNLQCAGCDTEYTQGRLAIPIGDIFDRVRSLIPNFNRPLIVVTGGEPFRQNITKLVYGLLQIGHVQLETNGTYNPPLLFPHEAWIVCSPKAGKVAPQLEGRIGSYKYVLDAGHVSPVDGLPTSILGSEMPPARPHAKYEGRIFVSPMDMGAPNLNELNTIAAVESCMRFGHVLNLQIHKLVGLP